MINRRRFVVPGAIAILALVLASPTLALELGRRPLLGVTATNLLPADRDANHLAADQGVTAQRITPGSGADRAGIQTGDILLSIDAEQIGSVDVFLRTVRLHHVGEAVKVTVLRAGESHEIVVTLAGL